MLLGMLKGMFLKNLGGKLAYLLLKDSVSDLKHQMDSEEYGGAPFLGAKQPVIKPTLLQGQGHQERHPSG